MSAEKRKSPRQRVLMRGQMVFGRGHSAVDCVLLDLSSGGAKVRTAAWLGIPDRFDLRMENGHTHGAEICYRDPRGAGVRFLDTA